MAKITPLRQLYQLHIRLDDIRPFIWRRILVDSRISLPKLHLTIQTVMGWQDSHMHEFFKQGIRYGIPDSDFPNKEFAEQNYRLDNLLKKPGDHLIYMYDFGTGWAHTITLEQIDHWDLACAKPLCVDGERACPPEDCGGPPGYEEIINLINSENPTQLKSYAKEFEFEPEEFDLSYVNQDLSRTLG